MAKNNPILIIDNDPEDQQFCLQALKAIKVKNKTILFDDGEEALAYLQSTSENPFLIICDLKMPKMNGIELRDKICENKELKEKSVPFIFLSGSAREEDVKDAYKLCVQGFFEKPNDITVLQDILKMVVDYWRRCKHPNSK